MAKAHAIVRRADVRALYIPLSESRLDDLIRAGQLETVQLSKGGYAIGITLRSILKYQTEVMGLAPLGDDEAGGGESIRTLPRRKSKKK